MSAGHPDYDARTGRDEIDLGGTMAALRRRKGLIVGATAGCAAAALAFCLVVKPRYLAEARVIVEDQESYFTRADPSSRESPQLIDAEAVNSQIQLVSSRDLARKVVAALRLQTLPEFDPTASGLAAMLSLLGGRGGPEAAEDRVLNAYFDHLTVMTPNRSRILQIEFSSRDPDLAAKAANTVADLYIDLKQQAKREEARQAAQGLKPLIDDLQDRVTEAEAKVADFRVANGLYESSENRSLPTQQLGEIATRLADARAAQSDAVAKAKALRDLLARGRLGDAGEISNNDLVRSIAARRSAVQAALAADSRTLLPGHPKIKEMQAQLSDIEAQLRAAVEKAARGLDNDARVAASRVANLSSLLEEQKQNVGVANGEETKLRELQRQAKTLRDQLETESAKYQAALAREKSERTPADARVVSRALAPSLPVFPKKVPITIFGAVAGLFFSSFYVIARELAGSGAPGPSPTETPLAGGGQGYARRPGGARGAPAPAGVFARVQAFASGKAARAETAEPIAAGAPPALRQKRGLFDTLKTALTAFGAPAVKLDDPPAPETPPRGPARPPAQEAAQDSPKEQPAAPDIWVRDPFGPGERAADPEPSAARDNLAGPGDRIRREPPQVSRDFIDRIAAAGQDQGVTALLADSDADAEPPHALATARALSRRGRTILVQASPDRRLDAALAGGASSSDRNPPTAPGDFEQPGLAQVLAGEASYAEAIYRDGATRLHLLAGGGPLDAEVEDLQMVIDVLRATYDFVLIAVDADALGLDLVSEADVVAVLGPPSARRDALRDDFAGAGARELILASPGDEDQLDEGAA